MSLNT